MAERVWDKYLTERDRQVFAASGFGATAGFGKKPALLIIDVNYAFCGDRREPILESIKRWRTSCGEDAWDAIPVIRKLVDVCHDKGIPVIYTTGERHNGAWYAGSWVWKNARSGDSQKPPPSEASNHHGSDIVDELAPASQDIVVRKTKPSAFFGTPLMSYLLNLGADSLIVAGTTTSGCVRATVLDAFSLNMRQVVVEEACFDRSQASHAVNLCDMHAKYADVMPVEEVLSWIGAQTNMSYNLPTAK